MREHYSKKVNVLGVDVSIMRPEKAANISMDLMRQKGLSQVFFLSAASSLFCQNYDWAMELMQSLPLVLAGDRYMERAAAHHQNNEEISEGIGEFAEEYLRRFLTKLNRSGREIFAVMKSKEHLKSLEEYISGTFPEILLKGMVYEEEIEGGPDKIVNEINANIPDVVFLCLPVEHQLMFIKDFSVMMNTRLCVCVESIQPLIWKETEEVPDLIHKLHLDKTYFWFKKEQKLKNMIVGSIFRKNVLNETGGDDSEKENQEEEK